jgi:hypothetical protein
MENYIQSGGGGSYGFPLQNLLKRSSNSTDGVIRGGGETREYKSYENLAIPIGLVFSAEPGLKSWKRGGGEGWIDDVRFDAMFSMISGERMSRHNKSKKLSSSKHNITKKN